MKKITFILLFIIVYCGYSFAHYSISDQSDIIGNVYGFSINLTFNGGKFTYKTPKTLETLFQEIEKYYTIKGFKNIVQLESKDFDKEMKRLRNSDKKDDVIREFLITQSVYFFRYWLIHNDEIYALTYEPLSIDRFGYAIMQGDRRYCLYKRIGKNNWKFINTIHTDYKDNTFTNMSSILLGTHKKIDNQYLHDKHTKRINKINKEDYSKLSTNFYYIFTENIKNIGTIATQNTDWHCYTKIIFLVENSKGELRASSPDLNHFQSFHEAKDRKTFDVINDDEFYIKLVNADGNKSDEKYLYCKIDILDYTVKTNNWYGKDNYFLFNNNK